MTHFTSHGHLLVVSCFLRIVQEQFFWWKMYWRSANLHSTGVLEYITIQWAIIFIHQLSVTDC